MKRCGHVLFGLALVGLAAPAGRAAEDARAEIQGTWALVRFERDGKEIKVQGDTRAVITGNKFVVKAGGKVIAAGTFRLDPRKKPKAVDMTYTEGPDKGRTFKGIYRLDGDRVKFCRAGSPDQERPTGFSSRAGGIYTVYRRVKR